MAESTIKSDILKIIERYAEETKKHFNVSSIILFGSYAKGTENEDSDIDIAIVSSDFDDVYDCMAFLMGLTWDIDTRIEPHPIKTEDYENVTTPFVQEVINTGIKVA